MKKQLGCAGSIASLFQAAPFAPKVEGGPRPAIRQVGATKAVRKAQPPGSAAAVVR